MADAYKVQLVRGQASVWQDFPIEFQTVDEAAEFAEDIIVGVNEAVLLLKNGEVVEPLKMGEDWPR